MNSKNSTIQKLSQYGVNASQLSQRDLQQKIIQMYDLLEQTTTQNLLLRKQNDDLSLQIKTIDQVFIDAQNSLTSGLSPRTYQKVCSQIIYDDHTQKTNVLQPHQNSLKSKQNIPFPSQKQNTCQKKGNYQNYVEEHRISEPESVQIQQKTPRYASKPHRNSRFCSDHKTLDKEQTSRMIIADKIDSQQQNSLNQKIQILMKQNQIIMKRMNQIEVNFIKTAQPSQENFKYHKNFDDRLTNFSSNITSIQNIWAKKDIQTHSRGLSSNNRTHYSTSNLRSYCPSIQ